MRALVLTSLTSAFIALFAVAYRSYRDEGALVRVRSGAGREAVGDERTTLGAYRRAAQALAGPAYGMLGRRGRARITETLDAAGRPEGMSDEEFAGRRALIFLGASVAGALLALRGNVVLGVLLPVLGLVYLDLFMSRLAAARQDRIERDIADLMDVLAVLVSSGMHYRSAMARVADAFEGPLADELATTVAEMRIGSDTRSALHRLRDRNRSPVIASFANTLVQAERLGIPIAATIAGLATEMRQLAEQRARRQAARATPRISLIVSVTVVPASVILITTAIAISSNFDVGVFLDG